MNNYDRDWAITKVQKLSPPTKEKSTLAAIASFADNDGSNCYAAIPSIALRSGHSERTVQRHIRTLQARGELQVLYQGKIGLRTNLYYITVCRLTTKELQSVDLVLKAQARSITTKQLIADQIQLLTDKKNINNKNNIQIEKQNSADGLSRRSAVRRGTS